jgi:tetratricopeptide (TPR) repeat protein
VRRQPDDASSYMRLGQTILLTTLEKSPEYPKALARAQTAYERAVALAPTDVRVWVALFRFYTGVQRNEEAADAMLRRLAQRIDIPQAEKVFVLAQLYESIGKRAEAGRFYLEAIKSAPAASQSLVLLRAARFFVADDPAQAESYCRQILKWHATSVDARRTLVRALAEQGGEARLHEAAELLTQVGRVGESTAADRRIEAILLAHTGRSEDRTRAIELLESLVQIPQQAQNQDRVLLASLYESDHRLMPAYEQLLAASRQDNVSLADLVQYAEFLYRNETEQPQFADYVEPVLAKLEQDPQSRASSIRLRLEAAKRLRETQRIAKIRATIDDASRRFITSEKDATLRRETFARLLFLLAHEDLAPEAISLVTVKSPCADPVDTAIALADALTLLPPGSKLARATDPVLRRAVEQFPRSAELAYSVANCRYVTQEWNDAVAMYRRVLEIKPDHKLAMNNLALALADRPQTAPEALELIDRAIKKFGADSALLDTKGQILVATGRAQEGLSVLADAAASRGGDALLLLHMAHAYLAVGKPAEARAAYRRARAENVADRVVTPGDRALLERLEAHLHQTATAGG